MKGCFTFFLIFFAISLAVTYWPITLVGLAIYLVYKINEEYQQKQLHQQHFQNTCNNYDYLDGHQFEHFCADVIKNNGFHEVSVTKASGDFGVDIIAFKDNKKYAIQCKCFSSNIGNKAVQEVYSGKVVYKADIAVVMTNRYFTQSAIETANKTGVFLWDRDKLNEMISNALNKQQLPQNYNSATSNETPKSLNKHVSTKTNNILPKIANTQQKDEVVNSHMYDKENGIFPAGTYLVGEDIPTGIYILKSRGESTGGISIYESYADYKKDDMISYNTFIGDYHLSLRENGIFIDVQNADMRKL